MKNRLRLFLIASLMITANVHAQWYSDTDIGSYSIPFTWAMSIGGQFQSTQDINLSQTTMPFARGKIIGVSVILKDDLNTRIFNLSRSAEKTHGGQQCVAAQDFSGGGNSEITFWDASIAPGILIHLHLDLQATSGNRNYFSQIAASSYSSGTINRGYILIDYLTH